MFSSIVYDSELCDLLFLLARIILVFESHVRFLFMPSVQVSIRAGVQASCQSVICLLPVRIFSLPISSLPISHLPIWQSQISTNLPISSPPIRQSRAQIELDSDFYNLCYYLYLCVSFLLLNRMFFSCLCRACKSQSVQACKPLANLSSANYQSANLQSGNSPIC